MITSRQNQHIKTVRKLLNQRKERDERGLFVAEGITLAIEAIQTKPSKDIEMVIYAPDLLDSDIAYNMIDNARKQNISCLETTVNVFKSISQKNNPQGLLVVVKQNVMILNEVSFQNELCWIALDRIQDPGNLGTILRTADSVGVPGIITIGNSVDPFHYKAVRASMGAIFTKKLIRASLEEFVDWKQRSNYMIAAAITRDAEDYQRVHYKQPLILMMGSEQHGLATELQAICDLQVSIPMMGRLDSLNVSTATAVIVYEILNQFHQKTGVYTL